MWEFLRKFFCAHCLHKDPGFEEHPTRECREKKVTRKEWYWRCCKCDHRIYAQILTEEYFREKNKKESKKKR